MIMRLTLDPFPLRARSELWDLFERGVDEKTTVLPIYDPLGALA